MARRMVAGAGESSVKTYSVDELFIFDRDPLDSLAEAHADRFPGARPFPHVVIDDFLPEPVARRILKEFPGKDQASWMDWRRRDPIHQKGKLEFGFAENMSAISPFLHHLLLEFNAFAFVRFLEKLTGTSKLIPDHHYLGGAFHQILNGGKLAIHADYNYHKFLEIFRRINVLYYLNADWRPEYGGALEFWDEGMTACVASIEPLFNRCVVFQTGVKHFHGHPSPWMAPDGVTRKSLAFYYYSGQPDEREDLHRLPIWRQEWEKEDGAP